MTILEDDNLGLLRGKADFGGIFKEVCLDYTPEVRVGDYVLVHVGYALAVIDEQEAQRLLEALWQLDQLEELEESAT